MPNGSGGTINMLSFFLKSYNWCISKYYFNLINFRPFERTAAENDQIYSIVHWYPDLSCQVEPLVLKELCVVAQLEVWKEANITCTSCSNTYDVIMLMWNILLANS